MSCDIHVPFVSQTHALGNRKQMLGVTFGICECSNVNDSCNVRMCPQEKQNHRMFSRITLVTLTG